MPIKIRLPSFLFNNRRKHPEYVFKEKNNEYYGILITHDSTYKKRKNIPLYKNPNPKDKSKAYVHNKVYKDDKKYFGKLYGKWKIDKNDKRKIKRIKKKAK